jgi:tRNA pseudouridine38-40 synthase
VTHDSIDEPVAPQGGDGLVRTVRLRVDLAYDGTDFAGWARQPGQRTVQGVLEGALSTVLRLGEPPTTTVAGRTDAGVHATGQVLHVDVPAAALTALSAREGFPAQDVVRRLTGVLPDDVGVRAVSLAPDGFDARFSALARAYRYRINDGFPDPLRRRDTLSWPRPLDAAAMAAAAASLVGEHDWAAYCRRREGATTIRRLLRLDVARDGDLVTVEAEADAFCHNLVRSLVGALLAAGDGRRPVHWPRQVLLAGERDPGVSVAPPHGLTLVAVRYPPDEELAARATAARRRRDDRD